MNPELAVIFLLGSINSVINRHHQLTATSNRTSVAEGGSDGSSINRRELRELSREQKVELVDSFEALRSVDENGRSRLNEIRNTSTTTRQLIFRLEEALNLTLPYWDFEMDRRLPNPVDSVLFHVDFLSNRRFGEGNTETDCDGGDSVSSRLLTAPSDDPWLRRKQEALRLLRRHNCTQFLYVLLEVANINDYEIHDDCTLCSNESVWLFCDQNAQRCVSKVVVNGNCSTFADSLAVCHRSLCVDGRCVDEHVAATVESFDRRERFFTASESGDGNANVRRASRNSTTDNEEADENSGSSGRARYFSVGFADDVAVEVDSRILIDNITVSLRASFSNESQEGTSLPPSSFDDKDPDPDGMKKNQTTFSHDNDSSSFEKGIDVALSESKSISNDTDARITGESRLSDSVEESNKTEVSPEISAIKISSLPNSIESSNLSDADWPDSKASYNSSDEETTTVNSMNENISEAVLEALSSKPTPTSANSTLQSNANRTVSESFLRKATEYIGHSETFPVSMPSSDSGEQTVSANAHVESKARGASFEERNATAEAGADVAGSDNETLDVRSKEGRPEVNFAQQTSPPEGVFAGNGSQSNLSHSLGIDIIVSASLRNVSTPPTEETTTTTARPEQRKRKKGQKKGGRKMKRPRITTVSTPLTPPDASSSSQATGGSRSTAETTTTGRANALRRPSTMHRGRGLATSERPLAEWDDEWDTAPVVFFSATIIEGAPRKKAFLNERVDRCRIVVNGANMPSGYTQTTHGKLIEGTTIGVISVLDPEVHGPLVEFRMLVFNEMERPCKQKCLSVRGVYRDCPRNSVRLTSQQFRQFGDPIDTYRTEDDLLRSQWSGRGYYRKRKKDYLLFSCPPV